MKKYTSGLYCLLVSSLMITICSTCSFLFPTNSWTDANCIFTVGRSMAHGLVPYRDIIDHKGFYLYLINMVGSLISRRSFFGMYVMEILFFSAFLYFSYRTFRLYVKQSTAIGLIPLLAAVTAACNSFDRGCSAEEFVLPMAAATIYFTLRYVQSDCDETKMNRNVLLINGILAGIVLWIKYTMLGLWFGFMAMVFFMMLSKKQVKRAFLSCLYFLAGMAAASVPVLLYFGVNGALENCWQVYFYDNIFQYSSVTGGLAERFAKMRTYYLRQSKGNPFVTLTIWSGLLLTALFLPVGKEQKHASLRRLALPVMYLFLLAGIYWGGKNYWYYFLITAPFAVTGLLALGIVCENTAWHSFWTGIRHRGLLAVLTLLASVWAWFTCNNAHLHLQKWEDTEQYQFARVMEQSEDPSLQVYRFLDIGFYNSLDIVPTCPYFTLYNLSEELMEEVYAAQYDTVLNEKTEYVICWENVPAFIEDRYHPVSWRQDSGHILLRRNNSRRYITTFVGREQENHIATADCVSWRCIREEKSLFLEGTLPRPVKTDAIKLSITLSGDSLTDDSANGYPDGPADDFENNINGPKSDNIPVIQVAGPNGHFITAQQSDFTIVRDTRTLLLTFPDMEVARLRVIPGQTDRTDWQARIDILSTEAFDEPLYAGPVSKALGHENSASSWLTTDNNFDTGWRAEILPGQRQIFDLILDRPWSRVCGIMLARNPGNDNYARKLNIYGTADNENWSLLESQSENQTDFFFDPVEVQMLRLIADETSGESSQEWEINEVYLWTVLPENNPL